MVAQGFVTMGLVGYIFQALRLASVVLDVNVSDSEEVVECCAVGVEVLLGVVPIYEHVHFLGDL